MKYLIHYILIIFSALTYLSCNKDNIITDPGNTHQGEGNTWTPAAMWPDTGNSTHYVSLQDIAVNANDEIFVATDFAGVFRTNDQGLNWEIVNDGLIKTLIYPDTSCFVSALTGLNNDIFCGNSNLGTAAGIYGLSDSENIWHPKIVWNKYTVITELKANNNGEIFAGCYYGLYLSKDRGNSWSDIGNDFNWNLLAYVYAIEFDSRGGIYIGTRNGIYLSIDGGSWSQIGFDSQTVISIAVNSRDEIFASLENSQIMFSGDGGLHWQEIPNPESAIIRKIFINRENLIFLCTLNGIYRSKDNGASFEQIGLKNIWIEKIVITSQGYMIAGSYRDGIFISKE